MRKIIILSAVLSLSLSYIYSQQGLLDPSFGSSGITRTDFGAFIKTSSNAQQVLTANDGSIYVVIAAGGAKIARLLPDGSIDKSYGNKGYSQPFSVSSEQYYYSSDIEVSAAIQEDKKIVLAGTSYSAQTSTDFIVARYKTDGTLDSTFSEDGIQTTDFFSYPDVANAVQVQHDGKIVVAGYTYSSQNNPADFAVARYNADGSLDMTFSNDGKQTTNLDSTIYGLSDDRAKCVIIQEDEKIVVGGSSDGEGFSIARYNVNGSLDSTFSDDGTEIAASNGQYSSVEALAVQANGRIVAVGTGYLNQRSQFAVARYATNGKLDSTFSGDGLQATDFEGIGANAYAVAIQKDGKILVSGSNGNFATARYNIDGDLDSSFSNNGKLTTDFASANYSYSLAHAIRLQNDGKIIAAGTAAFSDTANFAVVRYGTNGVLDSTFSADGKLVGNETLPYTVYTATALQKDGKLVAAGYAFTGKKVDFAIARYDSTGSLDTTFSRDGKQITHLSPAGDDFAKSVVIQADGKIVVGGSSAGHFALARYNTDGSLDKTFSKDGKQTTYFGFFDDGASLAIQTDGKIVFAGYAFTNDYHFAIARYNTDGTLDKTFSDDGKLVTSVGKQDSASAVVIQHDGKILVAGSVLDGFHLRYAVVRYNTDGSLDTTFSKDGKQTVDFDYWDGFATSLAIQKDEKIVVAGSAIVGAGYPDNYDFGVMRFTNDGTLDTTFSGDGKQSIDFGTVGDKATSVVLQKDGKIVAGGTSGGNFALARLNTNGSLDSTFSYDGRQGTELGKVGEGFNDMAILDDKLYAVGQTPYAYLYNGSDYDRGIGSFGAIARYFLGGNILPTVRLTAPANNAIYLAPASIKIDVSASDTDGTISKVDFYSGKTLIHSTTTVPYSFKWSNVPAGNYTLTAKVTDNGGLVTTSDTVHISVIPAPPNKAPTVAIIKPANYKTFPAPANIHIEAAAKDPDGSISKVEFFNGTNLLASILDSPYSYTWPHLPLGDYQITAKATDNNGVETASDVVNISVVPNIVPFIVITNPANNEIFEATDTIALIATAADFDGRITRVEFYSDSSLLRTEYRYPYTYHWENVLAGTYTITAVAVDNWGAKTTSAPVIVRVVNPSVTVANKSSVKKGEAERDHTIGLTLAPNPVNDILTIHTTGWHENKQSTLQVISSLGVLMKTMQLQNLNKTIRLDVSGFVSGVYTIRLQRGSKVITSQFVKL